MKEKLTWKIINYGTLPPRYVLVNSRGLVLVWVSFSDGTWTNSNGREFVDHLEFAKKDVEMNYPDCEIVNEEGA
jgi:hypothetical protein